MGLPVIDQPEQWGLSVEAVQHLGDWLHTYWERYAARFKTQTRDGSAYAYDYLSGQLRMEAIPSL